MLLKSCRGGGKETKKKANLRGAHSSLSISIRQSKQVVIVPVSRDFVAAVGVLGVSQECVLEPGHEFALEKAAQVPSLASMVTTTHEQRLKKSGQKGDRRRNEPPDHGSNAPSRQGQYPQYRAG